MLLSTKAKQTSAIYQVRELMLKTGTTTVSNFKSKLRNRGNPQLRAMEGSVLEETFDSLIESLVHHGPVLARVKKAYDLHYQQLMHQREYGRQQAAAADINVLHQQSVRGYKDYIAELELKFEFWKLEKKKLEQSLRELRHKVQQEEANIEELRRKQSLPQDALDSFRSRKILMLPASDAADVASLQTELLKANEELRDMKEVMQTKYVSKRRKETLQMELAAKEDLKLVLQAENRQLATRYAQLRAGLQAARLYASVPHYEMDQQSFIVASMGKTVPEEDLKALLEEDMSEEALQEEKETEIMLDCNEKFNELFETGRYKEAALVAANATRGILRSVPVLMKFVEVSSTCQASRPQQSRSPAVMYIARLVDSVAAFGPLPADLALHCTMLMVQEGRVDDMSSWLNLGKVVVTKELGAVIMEGCPCLQASVTSCGCICPSVAHQVYSMCGDHVQAAACLGRGRRPLAALDYGTRNGLTRQELAAVLFQCPSLSLAKVLMSNSNTEQQKLTLFEAMHLLLHKQKVSDCASLAKEMTCTLSTDERTTTECVAQWRIMIESDTLTSDRVWQSLLSNLPKAQDPFLNELGKELSKVVQKKLTA